MKHMKLSPFMKGFLKATVCFLMLIFISIYLLENWSKIEDYDFEIDFLYAGLAVLSILIAQFFLALALKNVVRLMKFEISMKKICLILFYSQIAKYLPGGIWGYVGRVYLYTREGMKAKDASACVLLETIIVVLCGVFVLLMLLLISLFFFDKIPSIEWLSESCLDEIGILFLIVLLLFVIHPRILNFIWGLMPAKICKYKPEINYKYLSLLKPGLFMVFFWLGIGTGFWFLIRSFFGIDPYLLPITTAVYILSWIAGVIVFFIPGGLGPREAVLIVSLNLYLPISISAITAVAARIWWVLGELIWASFSYLWNRLDNGRIEGVAQKINM